MNDERGDSLLSLDPEAGQGILEKNVPFQWYRKKYRGHNDCQLDPLRRAALPVEPGPDVLSLEEKKEKETLVHRLQTLVANHGNRRIDYDLVRAAIKSARLLEFSEEQIANLLGFDEKAYGDLINHL